MRRERAREKIFCNQLDNQPSKASRNSLCTPLALHPIHPSHPQGEYLITRRCAVIQVVEGILHVGHVAGQRQQEVHHLVKVPDEYVELVKLIGLAHSLDQGFHFIAQLTVGLHILQQALLCLLQHLQFSAEAAVMSWLVWQAPHSTTPSPTKNTHTHLHTPLRGGV